MDKFIVKHYSKDEQPILKGNGFDGLKIGEDKEDSEDFINFINNLIDSFQGSKRWLSNF